MSYDEILVSLRGLDNDFARSLLAGAAKYGSLTQKQMDAAERMIVRETKPAAPAVRQPVRLRNGVAVLFGLFGVAAAKLKHPRIRFRRGSIEFAISPAGGNSANAGSLYVKSDDKYLGKISPEGDFRTSRDATPAEVWSVTSFFDLDGDQMVEAFTSYGHETGSCCFCSLTLTDPRSVRVGYGPICASNFSLPWGCE